MNQPRPRPRITSIVIMLALFAAGVLAEAAL